MVISTTTSEAAPTSFVQSGSHEQRGGAEPEFRSALGDWFTRNFMYSGVLHAVVYVALLCTYANGAGVALHPAALVYGLLGSHVIYNYDRIMGCQSEDDRLDAPGRTAVAFLANCLAHNSTGSNPRVPGPWILASLFFLISAMVNWNDLRDEAGDRLVGTLSLPVLVGGEEARLISAGLFWISSVSAAAGGSWVLAPFALMNAVLAATLSQGSKFEVIPRL
ncbi:hypothetical protein KFL_005770020 [Klebsormidium nitens]|uniref:UbiA prenyltransferase family protein n=1 Tax=Klebsormidium nitens TaxID=105231 RepID=A0A1Y1IGE4_KLENI|nr:hypothetical protein KFL_005770020 [Klebsormidium nitens]|eukprot:GAQ89915.1 hypothetical protein KFL_005770020 [Klebsormidium nitens]